MASQITSLTIVDSAVYSRRRSKKTSKLRVTGLCEGNSPVAGEFPAQRASNAENVYLWWRHNGHISVAAWSLVLVTLDLCSSEAGMFPRIRAPLLWPILCDLGPTSQRSYQLIIEILWKSSLLWYIYNDPIRSRNCTSRQRGMCKIVTWFSIYFSFETKFGLWAHKPFAKMGRLSVVTGDLLVHFDPHTTPMLVGCVAKCSENINDISTEMILRAVFDRF